MAWQRGPAGRRDNHNDSGVLSVAYFRPALQPLFNKNRLRCAGHK
jgi:hypothetical protein